MERTETLFLPKVHIKNLPTEYKKRSIDILSMTDSVASSKTNSFLSHFHSSRRQFYPSQKMITVKKHYEITLNYKTNY